MNKNTCRDVAGNVSTFVCIQTDVISQAIAINCSPKASSLQATYFGFFVKYFYWTDALELDHLFMEVPYTPADGKD
jgi:hypothetical protein